MIDTWFNSLPEDEKETLCIVDIWNAAVEATVTALYEAGNLDKNYREETTKTINKIKSY